MEEENRRSFVQVRRCETRPSWREERGRRGRRGKKERRGRRRRRRGIRNKIRSRRKGEVVEKRRWKRRRTKGGSKQVILKTHALLIYKDDLCPVVSEERKASNILLRMYIKRTQQ